MEGDSVDDSTGASKKFEQVEDPACGNGEQIEGTDFSSNQKSSAVAEIVKRRSASEITIEATVDTGFEFMAIEECRKKFGQDFPVLKERGRIVFNIDKSKYSEVLQLRSVDNLYLVLSFDPKVGFKGSDSAEDVATAKKQAHNPDWDFWLNVWKELSGFEGILKPTLEQYEVANERATKDKEAEKIRQAERQKKFKERQERNAEKRARREAKAAIRRAQYLAGSANIVNKKNDEKADAESSDAVESTVNSEAQSEIDVNKTESEETVASFEKLALTGTDFQSNEVIKPTSKSEKPTEIGVHEMERKEETVASSEQVTPSQTDLVVDESGSLQASDPQEIIAPEQDDLEDEIQSLPDYEREQETEIDASVPPGERVLRFRATCFRVGKHSFGSMEVAREFGGELQDKFHWVVDLVNFNAEIVLFILGDTAQVNIALTKRSLHRRNISFFGPTTLRSTVCHNLLRLADVKPGDIILDPLAGGGSISVEGAMSFPGCFHIGGDIHSKAMSRFYSNVRVLQAEVGKDLAIGAVRWDARRLPLNEASVDIIVSDLPFGIRQGSKSGNRNLYRSVLLEMARVIRPGSGRAILLTQDRKSFALALTGTMGLWWQSKVMSVNIGGLDTAVFTLRRTAKLRPDEEDLVTAAAEKAKSQSMWQERGNSRHDQRGRGRGFGQRGRGKGFSRGRGYPRGNKKDGSYGGNWRKPSSSDVPKSDEN